MLKRAVAILLLAFLFGYTDLLPTLRILLLPPNLPLNYAFLPFTTSLQSFTIHSYPASPSPLKFCEDAAPFGDQVLLSCDPHRIKWNTVMGPLRNASAGKGALWMIDPLEEQPEPEEVQLLGFPEQADFHPLGIELEGDRLFVINHQAQESTIEIFSLSSSSLTATYLMTLRHPSFTGAPNSLAILSPTSFYLTHDHYHTRRDTSFFGKLMNLVETLGRRKLARVDLVSFSLDSSAPAVEVRTVAEGIAFANGAALSHDRQTLAIASTSARLFLLFSRNVETNDLKLEEEIPLPFFVDNLSLAPRDFLTSSSRTDASSEQDDPPASTFIAAGHPAYIPLLATSRGVHLSRTAQHPSSWVIAITPRSLSSSSRPSFPSSASPDADSSAEPAYSYVPRHPRYDLLTFFQSSGGSQYDEMGFGMSTTGVVGVGHGAAEVRGRSRRRWLVVVGLYERGVRVVRGR